MSTMASAKTDTEQLKQLCQAIEKENIDLILSLLGENGASYINQELEEGVYPINIACSKLNPEIVRLLIQNGADVNIPGADGRTPLHYVCKSKDKHNQSKQSELLEIIDVLFEFGAIVDLADNIGCTPIFSACELDDVKAVQKFISYGCSVNVQTVSGESPLQLACRNAEFWFFWHGRDTYQTTETLNLDAFPPVCNAKQLLMAGADPKQATFLPAAVQFGFVNLVIELLELGMDINMLDDHQRTPLGLACSSANVSTDVVKLLLHYGADVNKGGGWKRHKPVIFAYVHNSVEKLKLLLSYGAQVTEEEITELVSVTLSKSILENPEVVNLFSKELMSWRLLLSAGFQPQFSGNLASKVHTISMCSSYEKIKPWIQSLLFPLRSLKDYCRITIRNSLPISIDKNVEVLPLPSKLKEYLMFKEFCLRE